MGSDAWAGRVVTDARARWERKLRGSPLPCWQCNNPVILGQHRWVVEHIRPRSLGGSLTDPSNQWVSHRSCSDSSGGKLAHAMKHNDRKAREGFRDWGRRANERGNTRPDGDGRPATLF